MSYREEPMKRKADDGATVKSSRRRTTINNHYVRIDPYVIACQDFQEEVCAPAEFMCALTKTIMSDPVNLSTGQTVDRCAFERLFDFMPDELIDQVTGIENLSSAVMTPNVELQTRMKNWHRLNQQAKLRFQLKMFSYPREFQIASARELRSMVRDSPEYAKAFTDIGPSAFLDLVKPLLESNLLTFNCMHEDILVTAAQLAKYNLENREPLVQNQLVVDIILGSLRHGTFQSRLSALNLVYYIATVPSCRGALVRAGVISHLYDLLASGSMLVMNHAVSAICELCNESDYLDQFIKKGVINSISLCLPIIPLTDKYACFFSQLSSHKLGLQQLVASENIYNWLINTLRHTKLPKVAKYCLKILSRILPISKAALTTTIKHEMEAKVNLSGQRSSNV